MASGHLSFKDALVFTGGGTGGHYYPAVALAEGARERWPDCPVAFVGAQRGIEARKLPGSGWPHLLLDVEGFLGRSPVRVIRSAWKLWRAKRQLVALWRDQRPWAIVATGGYGSAPALYAARALQIPYFVHESNAEPGALVRQVATGARRVWLGLKAAESRLAGAPIEVVGTPVRAAFMREFTPYREVPMPRRILVLGGSGGARALNEAVLSHASGWLEGHPGWEILHQTGPTEHSRLSGIPRHPKHQLVPFIEDMDQTLDQASLVISRSGASTCAELKVCGRPALLVPFPKSAGGHQLQNALALKMEGRAKVVEEGAGFPERLDREVRNLLAEDGTRLAMARPEPNRAVERCLEDLAAALS